MENVTKKKKKKYQYSAYLWLLPAIVLLLVFNYYPAFTAFIDSLLSDANIINTTGTTYSEEKFIWLNNFKDILTDPIFFLCIKNVFIFTIVGIVFGNLMTIVLAELLFNMKSKRASSLYRFMFIIPILVPGVVTTMIWQYIVFGGDSSGLINGILALFNIGPKGWYFDPDLTMISIILTGFPWVAGTSFLIYLAGFQNISPEIFEAAKLDGATIMQRIFKIDLPLISGQLKYFLIMGVIGGIQNFNLQLLIMGSGVGTTNNANVPGYYLYNLFENGAYNKASAVGILIFIITFILTLINMKLTKKGEN